MVATTAFEAFKKGDFDIYSVITPKRWVTETNTAPFQKNWIIKQKIYNYAPHGFNGLAFNMRKPLFRDVRIREAISHLLDRKYILEKLMFNQYQPLSSYGRPYTVLLKPMSRLPTIPPKPSNFLKKQVIPDWIMRVI